MTLLRGIGVTVISEILAKFPLLAFEAFLASYFPVSTLADWSRLQVLLRALPYLHMGSLSAYVRRYPLHMGRQQNRAAARLDADVFGATVWLGALWGVLAAIAGAILVPGSIFVPLGLLVATFAAQIYAFEQARLRNRHQFGRAAVLLCIYAFTVLLLGVPLVWTVGLAGPPLAYGIAYLFGIAVARRRDYAVKTTMFTVLRLIRWGTQTFALTISHFFLIIADRLALTLVGGDAVLAAHAVIFLFTQVLNALTGAIGRVLMPILLQAMAGQGAGRAERGALLFAILISLFGFVAVGFLMLTARHILAVISESYIYLSEVLPAFVAIATISVSSQCFFSIFIAHSRERQIVFVNTIFFFLSILAYLVINKLGHAVDILVVLKVQFVVASLYGFIILLLYRRMVNKLWLLQLLYAAINSALLAFSMALII